MKRLLKQRILALYHDFHWVVDATKFLTVKIHSIYVKESGDGPFGKVGVGVGHLISDSATPWCCIVWKRAFAIQAHFAVHWFVTAVLWCILISLTVPKPLWDLTTKYHRNRTPKLTDWFRTWLRRRDFTFRCNSWPAFCIFLYNGWADEKAKVSIHKIFV